MKFIILFAVALVALASAAPADEPTKIVRSKNDQSPDGAYEFAYETDDGSKRFETAVVKSVVDADGKPQSVLGVRGSYSYINPEGRSESITYEADENGFRADGESIPVVPAVRR